MISSSSPKDGAIINRKAVVARGAHAGPATLNARNQTTGAIGRRHGGRHDGTFP